MTRVPIRLRVTLAFTIVMAILLTALGFFVYSRFESQLSEQVDQSLRTHAATLHPERRALPSRSPRRQTT